LAIFDNHYQVTLDRIGFESYFQFQKPRMFVCLCHVTTEHEVRSAIDRGAETVDEVAEICNGAGTGCGGCRSQIHDMLEAAGRGCDRTGRACSDCPCPRIPVALPLTADSREAA
jgi:bacterioferritin-associated ferredoxin